MKKVLSIVLSIAMVVCLAPTMAFAATTNAAQSNAAYSDIEGTACEGAVNVLSALKVVDGFTDGTYKPEQTVTRAQMAKLIVTALGVADYATAKTSKYTDMGAATWAIPYVEYASNLNIVNGVGNNKFNPNGLVTYEQAATMVVRALGYTDQCKEMNGTWPAIYVQKAMALNIFDNVVNGGANGANRGDVAIMLYNALEIAEVYADGDGATQYKTGNDTTTYNGKTINGVTMMGTLNKNGSAEYKVIDEKAADTALYNIREYVGAAGRVVTNKDGKVIAIGDIKTVFLTGDFDADDKEFTVGDTVYKLNPANVYSYFAPDGERAYKNTTGKITNGKSVTPSDITYFKNGVATDYEEGTSPEFNEDRDNITIACKVDGKTITDVFSISEWKDATYRLATTSDISNIKNSQKVNGKKFPTDNNGDIDYTGFSLEGIDSFDKLAVDNVLEIYTKSNSNDITKVAVGTEKVEGTVTKVVSSNGSKAKVTVDGKTYKAYDNTSDNGTIGVTGEPSEVKAGNKVTLYLTASGKIYKAELEDGTSDYGVVINTGFDKDAFGKVTYQIKMITPDGAKTAYTVDSDYVDDHPDMFTITSESWSNDKAPKPGQFIKYSVDSNGKIDEYKLITTESTPKVEFVDAEAKAKINKSGYYNGKKISASAAIYTYKDSSDYNVKSVVDATSVLTTKNKDYKAVKLDSLLDSDALVARVIVKDNEIVAMLINDGSVSTKDVFGVVTEIASIDDDDYKSEVTMLIDGKEVTYKTSKTPKYNKVYKLDFDTAGQIDVFNDVSTEADNNKQLLDTVLGSDDGIEVKNDAVKGTTKNTTIASDIVVYNWNSKDGNFEVGSVSDIETADANTTVKLIDTTTGSDQDKIANIAIVIPTNALQDK